MIEKIYRGRETKVINTKKEKKEKQSDKKKRRKLKFNRECERKYK